MVAARKRLLAAIFRLVVRAIKIHSIEDTFYRDSTNGRNDYPELRVDVP